jgi:hypothetical protein
MPDGIGWTTADGGIAVGDLSRTGRRDLVVFWVDDADDNAGYLRVGRDLGADGQVHGGWSAVRAVGGWFGGTTTGADIALADLDGSGRLDAVVFHIDSPRLGFLSDRGHYRIGRDLTSDGDTSQPWSSPIEIPIDMDDAVGGGISLVDLDGSGRPDLVVCWVSGRAYYAVRVPLSHLHGRSARRALQP